MRLVLDEQAKLTCKRGIVKYSSKQILSRIRLGRNTNKFESINATLSKILPKGRHFQSTMPERAHLAVICRNNGLGSAVV